MGAAGSKRFKSQVASDEVVSFSDDSGGQVVDTKSIPSSKSVKTDLISRHSDCNIPAARPLQDDDITTLNHLTRQQKDISVSELSITEFADDKTSTPQRMERYSEKESAAQDSIPQSSRKRATLADDDLPEQVSLSDDQCEQRQSIETVIDIYDPGNESHGPHSPILSPKSNPQRMGYLAQPSPSRKEGLPVQPNRTGNHSSTEFKSSSDHLYSGSLVNHHGASVNGGPGSSVMLNYSEPCPGSADIMVADVSPLSAQQKVERQYFQPLGLQQRDTVLRSPESPERSFLSPLISDTDEDSLSLAGYGSIMQKVRMENQSLLELQRQRTMSTMNNAKLEMEVEGLMKQLEYLDKLEADEESNRRRGYDGGYAANGESVRQQRSVGIKFEQTGQNRGRIAPEPSRSVGAHMRMDHSHEANEGRGSATGHTRIPTQSKFSTGVARSVSDVQPSSDNGEVGRQVASLQDSLVTMGIVADRKNSMKPSPSGRFHKFTSRPLDSRTRAAGNVSPRDEKREKLSVSPIRRGPGGVSSPSHLSEAQNQLSDINSQSDVQKSLKNGLVAPEPTDRGAKSFPKRHQQPHLAPPSRTQGGFGTIDKANRGIEDMEESVDEESSIVEQEDSRRPCLEMKCIQECNISEKTTRSRNVLRSVNRRHRHSADPESVISSYKSTSTELKMGSAKELIDIKYKSGETDGPYSEPKSSSSDQFSRSQSKASGQGVMSSFGSARGGGVLDPPGTLELACTDSKTNLKGDVNFGDGERRVRAARQNRERADEGQKSRPRALQKDTVSGDQSSTSPMPDWSKTMDMRKGEVELLLRRPINSDEDIQFTLAAAEAGLIFMDELDRVAKSLHMLRGSLSRWLLPYDNNTAITDQISSVHSVVASMPDYLRGRLTERQVNYLVSGVNGVRQLIRVKIADDNDLEQAREALQTAVDFLKRLQTDASSASGGMTPYQLLRFN